MNPTAIPSQYEFQETLRHFRINHGPTQKAMAEILGVSPQFYSDLERGKRKPSVRIAESLARFEYKNFGFDHTLEYFVTRWHTLAANAHGWRL